MDGNAAATGSSARSPWRPRSLFALDDAGPARAALRHDALQRSAARRAAHVADAAVQAAEGAGAGGHHRRASPARRRRRVPADPGRARICARRHVDGLLGAALDRDPAVAEESRSVAADVGHAPQSRPAAAAAATLHDTVPVPRASAGAATGGWSSTAARSTCAAVDPGLRGRPLVSGRSSMTAIWMGISHR